MGTDLLELLNKDCLSYDEKTYILFYVALGVQKMHRKMWPHSDIKPENILCNHDAASPVESEVVLSDFDFARKYEECQELVSCGTPGYAAPELFKANGERGKGAEKAMMTDVFSLGRLMMVTIKGCIKPVFSEEDKGEEWYDICSRMVNSVATERPKIDEVVEALRDL